MYTINTQIELNSLQVVEIKIIELLFYFIVYLYVSIFYPCQYCLFQ